MQMLNLLGVDTGGTFTDFVLLRIQDDGLNSDNHIANSKSADYNPKRYTLERSKTSDASPNMPGATLTIHKVLSTPDAPERAILQGIAELGLTHKGSAQQGSVQQGDDECSDDSLLIIHGSTVATNAVLEGKGVKTAFITNRGMGDMLTIGRQARAELYNLQPHVQSPPVEKAYCLETGGRIDAAGNVIEALTDSDLSQLRAQLKQLAPKSVAINLLFSFLDKSLEQRIADIVPKNMFVSCSSQILPEYKEYERGITTWLNAAVGPLVKGYLERLSKGLAKAQQFGASERCRISIMQSSGGTIDAQQAAQQAVHMLLSGPAGGMAGARYVAAASHIQRILTFDMGGTSTDVAMIDGEIQLTTDGYIGPYPVAVPMVDMHTIGAGGGSIASVDAGGLLRVGPESAGAAPGPACYGQGGVQATVTDANLLLGRLLPGNFLGGAMSLDLKAAINVIKPIATALNTEVEQAALGIIQVANEHMARALRVMSVERGIDPRELTLVSFGGAGGLHVCALAEALGMTHAMVPIHAGVLSALGMLVAPRQRHLSQSYSCLLSELNLTEVQSVFDKLIEQGVESLVKEGVHLEQISFNRRVDLRYQGQSYSLTADWQDLHRLEQDFHQQHESRYGHQLDQAVELVTLRVRLQARANALDLSNTVQHVTKARLTDKIVSAELYGIDKLVPIYDRTQLQPGKEILGPALITETVATTFIAPGWMSTKDMNGNMLLSK